MRPFLQPPEVKAISLLLAALNLLRTFWLDALEPPRRRAGEGAPYDLLLMYQERQRWDKVLVPEVLMRYLNNMNPKP